MLPNRKTYISDDFWNILIRTFTVPWFQQKMWGIGYLFVFLRVLWWPWKDQGAEEEIARITLWGVFSPPNIFAILQWSNKNNVRYVFFQKKYFGGFISTKRHFLSVEWSAGVFVSLSNGFSNGSCFLWVAIADDTVVAITKQREYFSHSATLYLTLFTWI